ncbi:MAG TPA: hypothetical protein VHO93_06210 [Actinomycetota bacterium]|nr:hypothetical protein [Actinomycetota bacterium]
MPCPDLGALRASLDAPDGAPAAPRDHASACPSCSATLAELQRNAELAAPAVALTAPGHPPAPAEVEAALARLEQRRARLAATPAATSAPAGPAPVPAAAAVAQLPRRGRLARMGARTRGIAAALVAALVLTGLVATPAGRAAAGSFLAQFRSQRFEVLALDPAQSTQVGDVFTELVDTGVFTGNAFQDSGFGEPQVAADRAQASRVAGFAVPVVDPAALPRGVERTPQRIMVSRAREARITFDRGRALDYLRDHGRPDAQLPERYDGTQLVIQLPAVVVQQFAGRDGGPALLVGKAGTLGLGTEGGASLEELREVVLGLPGLPAETVAQLRAIGDWRTTLPLPVPADDVRWSPTMVEGAEAIGFADQTGRLHALLWQRDGHIYGVAGQYRGAEVKRVAERLG